MGTDLNYIADIWEVKVRIFGVSGKYKKIKMPEVARKIWRLEKVQTI
jgi:hypothetical protein